MADNSWELIFELLDDLRRSIAISDKGILVTGYQLEAVLDSKGLLTLSESVKSIVSSHHLEITPTSLQKLKNIHFELVCLFSRSSEVKGMGKSSIQQPPMEEPVFEDQKGLIGA